MWWEVADSAELLPSSRGRWSRVHTRIDRRAITVFRRGGDSSSSQLTAIDSICAHAGGNLTAGPVQDIEELGLSVVLCPLHRYMYAIHPPEMAGAKVYQALQFKNGKPSGSQWTATKKGSSCQRSHLVREGQGKVYVKINNSDVEQFASDRDSKSDLCANQFVFHSGAPIEQAPGFEP